jgi:HAD superfamily hydrolase (TIGR01509 family)
MPIKAILFDLDDTLINDDASFALSLQRLCSDFGFQIEKLGAAYSALSPPYWGAGDLAAQREAMWRAALSACGYDTSLAADVRDRYLYHRVETSAPLDGTEAVLSDLGSTYRLAVITNGGGDIQPERLRHAGLAGYFDVLVTSSDVDVGKPDRRIFEHALNRLDVSARQAWVVGDHLASDVAGALNVGATGVWFNPRGHQRRHDQPKPHHDIASLAELRGLLS